MIKMDVEGHEDDVLRGGEAILANPALRLIELETTSAYSSKLMADHKFAAVYYDPFGRRLSDEPLGYEADPVFVRDREFVAARLASAKPVTIFGREI
jgi:hypothetical protein